MDSSIEPAVPASPYRLVDRKGLAAQYGIAFSPQHILRLETADRFPRRVYLTGGRALWRASEIESWISERLAQRGAVKAHTVPEQHRYRRAKASSASV